MSRSVRYEMQSACLSSKAVPPCVPVMSEASRPPNNFQNLAQKNIPSRLSYNIDVLTHPNGQFDHHHHRDDPVVSPLPFSVFEYLEWHPRGFHVGGFSRMQTNGYELQEPGRLGACHGTAVARWANAEIMGAFLCSQPTLHRQEDVLPGCTLLKKM